jgi:transcriptional regulator with XRE-family HTH domain
MGKKFEKNQKLMEIFKRTKLSQKELAEKTTQVWQEISGRTLSANAVSEWVNGKSVPKLSPNEHAAILSILDCTAFEWAQAFWAVEQRKKHQKSGRRQNNS